MSYVSGIGSQRQVSDKTFSRYFIKQNQNTAGETQTKYRHKNRQNKTETEG